MYEKITQISPVTYALLNHLLISNYSLSIFFKFQIS